MCRSCTVSFCVCGRPIEDDPSLAIGTAKELVETTCKTILHARKVAFSESADIGEW